MNAKELGGQPADRPQVETTLDSRGAVQQIVSHGLTKREAFAMAAMQGLVANGFSVDTAGSSQFAVKHADALLAELEKDQP